MSEAERFEQWCVVEVFGHQTYAGLVTEQTVGGGSFVRIDIPELPPAPADGWRPAFPGQAAFTKLFGAGAIYSLTPVTEEVARAAAMRAGGKPLNVYLSELSPPPAAHVPRPLADYDFTAHHDAQLLEDGDGGDGDSDYPGDSDDPRHWEEVGPCHER